MVMRRPCYAVGLRFNRHYIPTQPHWLKVRLECFLVN